MGWRDEGSFNLFRCSRGRWPRGSTYWEFHTPGSAPPTTTEQRLSWRRIWNMRPGDTVSIEIEGLGTLTNPVRNEGG